MRLNLHTSLVYCMYSNLCNLTYQLINFQLIINNELIISLLKLFLFYSFADDTLSASVFTISGLILKLEQESKNIIDYKPHINQDKFQAIIIDKHNSDLTT